MSSSTKVFSENCLSEPALTYNKQQQTGAPPEKKQKTIRGAQISIKENQVVLLW